MNYKAIYERFCKARKTRGLSKESGYEIHHIIPRSLGGTDDEDNLVKLTHKEHLFAHKLMIKFNNSPEMNLAYYFMKYVNKTGSKDYEENRNRRNEEFYKINHEMKSLPFNTVTYLPVEKVSRCYSRDRFLSEYLVKIVKFSFKKPTSVRFDMVKLFLAPLISALEGDYIYFQYHCQRSGWRSEVLEFLKREGFLEEESVGKVRTIVFKIKPKFKKYLNEDLSYTKRSFLYNYSKKRVRCASKVFSASKDFYLNFMGNAFYITPINSSISPKYIPKNLLMKPMTLKELESLIENLHLKIVKEK